MTPVVVSGGELTALAGRPGTLPQFPLGVVPRLDKDGTIVDLERIAASFGDPDYVYRTQPMVRMVVDWRVSRMIRVPLHAYVKQADGSPAPEDGDVESNIWDPAAGVSQARWLAEIAYDWNLHDRWLVMVVPRDGGPGYDLQRLPAWRWSTRMDGLGRVVDIVVDGSKRIDPAACVFDIGRGGGTSPMKTLQEVLTEIIEGAGWRRQQWEKGVRARAVIERPETAPDWTTDALERFQQGFGDEWTGSEAAKAGGVPVLEDGMTLKQVDLFSAADTEYLEGLRLNGVFVCGVYDTAPELVGLRPSNYANQDAHRQAIYRETLGGDFTRIEQALQGIVPRIVRPRANPTTYLKFLIDAALRGSFIEQATVVQTLVGRPIFTGDEGRALYERPPLGGNMAETVTPLNVLIGDLASPRDTAPALADRGKGEKAAKGDWRATVRGRLESELAAVFADQAAAVVDQLGGEKAAAAAPLEWDAERWDAELAAVFLRYGYLAARAGAKEVLDRFGDGAGDFNEERLLPWLTVAASNTASKQNQVLQQKVSGVLLEPDWQDQVLAVFAVAGTRAKALSGAMVAETSSFGAHDAARFAGVKTKTWHTPSARPRASHAALSGETVGIDEVFSNGLRYPGDSAGSADETAGCTCTLTFGG